MMRTTLDTIFKHVSALFLKQWRLQRRAYLMNLFLVVLPIFFIVILYLLQMLVEVELSSRDFKCGCKCLKCCDWVSQNVPATDGSALKWQCFTADANKSCSASAQCSAYNDTDCGPQYSSYQQVAFCDLSVPPVWPAVLQVPPNQYRNPVVHSSSTYSDTYSDAIAGSPSQGMSASSSLFNQTGSPILVLYTGQNKTWVSRFMQNIVAKDSGIIGTTLIQAGLAAQQQASSSASSGGGSGPSLISALDLCSSSSTAATLTSILAAYSSPSQSGQSSSTASNNNKLPDSGDAGNAVTSVDLLATQTTVLTQFLSNYSFTLGSAADTAPTLLIEPAFFPGTPLYGAAATESGSSSSSSSSSVFTSASSPLSLNSSQVLPLYYLSPNCSALTSTDLLMLNQLSCGFKAAFGVPLVCASVLPVWLSTDVSLAKVLYCGWSGSECIDTEEGNLFEADAVAAHQEQMLVQGVTASSNTASSVPPVTAAANSKTIQFASLVLDWGSTDVNSLDLTIWVNNSNLQAQIEPTNERWAAALNVGINAFLQTTLGLSGRDSEVSTSLTTAGSPNDVGGAPTIKLTGVKGFPVKGNKLTVDFSSLLGPVFFMWVMQLLLPTFVHSLVSEQVGGHLGLMKQQGLRPAAYYVATYLWELMLYIVFMAVFVGFGAGIGLSIFTKTAAGVQVITYLLWGHVMIAVAFWVTEVWPSSEGAVLASIAAVIFTGLVANLVVVQFVQGGPDWFATLLEIVPSFTLFRALYEMSQYAFLSEGNGGPGLTFKSLHDPGNGMILAWIIMGVETVVIIGFSLYYQQVFSSHGSRRHPLFLLGFKLGPDEDRGWAWFFPHHRSFMKRFMIPRCISVPSPTQQLTESRGRPAVANMLIEDNPVTLEAINQPECTGEAERCGGRGRPDSGGARRTMSVSSDVEAGSRTLRRKALEGAATASGSSQEVLMEPSDVMAERQRAEAAWRDVLTSRALDAAQDTAVMTGNRGCDGHHHKFDDDEQSLTTASDKMETPVRVPTPLSTAPLSPWSRYGVVGSSNALLLWGSKSPLKISTKDDRSSPRSNLGSHKYVGPYTTAQSVADPSLASPPVLSKIPLTEVAKQGDERPALILRGVRKEFHRNASPFKQLSSSGESAAQVHGKDTMTAAVCDLSLIVGARETFGFLGPNGAGKTTALRMMQGMLEPSRGDIFVCGVDLARNPWECALEAGVCPQHDVLWPSLTGWEHLMLYAQLKGMVVSTRDKSATLQMDVMRRNRGSPQVHGHLSEGVVGSPNSEVAHRHGDVVPLGDSVEECLEAVGLHGDVAHHPCGTYSGGMRRRLSVAMCMVGRPSIIYLDEPSTGLDPASKRQLWKAIDSARARCAIVMTTHYMEEAEKLCDRLGIFVSGRLRCIGSPLELTARYSQCLLLHVTTPEAQEEETLQIILRDICPTAKRVYGLGGVQTFELPKSQVELRDVFRSVISVKTSGALQIQDWGVTNATLDQVFLRIVGAAAAAAVTT
ncbi:hypothetical protein CEUSTIGMA_g4343.t1 [Chlamydomonas eustigma]|uniref:ABC transporter domain-containing protein n=1 Tax=Chlamydomonas eustigma TaxID=1157962 RepID=A0A250X1E1_9CHLO|nr:hypothetical protein CEUSTIGMA_g4343.t1 [Chlamydomonas eustigma]|eukprot:GAX76897.1 hypothetical protein CEUSTIGMA_g4343.t1 [Chlamydomonas eustigma]